MSTSFWQGRGKFLYRAEKVVKKLQIFKKILVFECILFYFLDTDVHKNKKTNKQLRSEKYKQDDL